VREYIHPEIDHSFTIKDVGWFEIEIDGVKVHRREIDGFLSMANAASCSTSFGANDLSLCILQHVLAVKNQKS